MTPEPLKDPDERGDGWIGKRIVTPDGEAGLNLDKTAVIPTPERDQFVKLIMARSQQEPVGWDDGELELVAD
jgi:hypothetical protein